MALRPMMRVSPNASELNGVSDGAAMMNGVMEPPQLPPLTEIAPVAPPELPAIPPEPEVEPDFAIDPEITDREQTVDNILSIYKNYRDWRELNIEPMWDACYRAYRGFKPSNSHPYKTIYVIREIFRQVETRKALVSTQLLGGETLFQYTPEEDGFEEETTAATRIVHKQIKRKGHRELQKWLDAYTQLGTSYITAGWHKFNQQTRKIAHMHSVDGQEWWDRKTEERLVESPYLKALNPWDVYTHPFVEDPRDSPMCYVREAVSPSDLKTLVREGWLDEAAVTLAMDEEAGGGTNLLSEQRADAAPNYNANLDNSINGDAPRVLMTCWSSAGWEYAVLDDKHLVRGKRMPDNGRAKIWTHRNYSQAGEHYGLPEAWVMLEDQKILNDMMGLYIDKIHYELNPMFRVDPMIRKEWTFLTFKPGAAVYAKAGEVEMLQTDKSGPMALRQESQGILHNMQTSTGLTNEVAGTGTTTKTATMGKALQDAAGVRVNYGIQLLIPGFQELYLELYDLNARYLNKSVALRIAGVDGGDVFERYGPDAFEPSVDVDVEVGAMQNIGPQAASRWQTAYQNVGMDPLVDRYQLLLRMFRAQGEKKPRALMASGATSQLDALDETRQIQANGILQDPKTTDNHQAHVQIDQMFMQTPDFMAMPPEWQQAFMRHDQIHQQYVNAAMMAAGAASQAPVSEGAPGASGVGPEANMRAEQEFGNANEGAAQQGRMPNGQ